MLRVISKVETSGSAPDIPVSAAVPFDRASTASTASKTVPFVAIYLSSCLRWCLSLRSAYQKGKTVGWDSAALLIMKELELRCVRRPAKNQHAAAFHAAAFHRLQC